MPDEPTEVIVSLIPIDRPNGNGRTYTRDVLEKACKKLEGKSLPLKASQTAFTGGIVDHRSPDLGRATRFRVDESGWLVATITPLDTALIESITSNKVAVRTAGFGMVDNDGIITDFDFTGTFLTTDPA